MKLIIGNVFLSDWPCMWRIWWKRRRHTLIYENGQPVKMTARRWLRHMMGKQPYGCEAHFFCPRVTR